MSSEERDQERGFKVADRRRFSETGDARETAGEAGETAEAGGPQTASSDAPTAGATRPAEQPAAGTGAAASGDLPEIDFSTFIIGLSAQALAHLGEIPDPVHQAVRVDLDAARQVIDILGLLRDKTAGNLDKAEAPLLESVLYDLRMKYVERVRGS